MKSHALKSVLAGRIANAVAVLGFLLLAPLANAANEDCRIGTYRFADGTAVDVAPSGEGKLRWRRFDGSTGAFSVDQQGRAESTLGWTGRPDGNHIHFDDCSSGGMTLNGKKGRRIEFDVTNVKFVSDGVTLVGRLVMPKGTGVVPIVVLIHGAEHDSARRSYALQRMLPAEGIAAFVYDKRGTGDSSGEYTQNFEVLADDAIAAMGQARILAGHRAGRIGYQGGSQGGWVAPIAANRQHVDFVIVSFGLAVSVIDEDQQEVEIEMREKGHSPAEIADALQVASAAETVIASGFTQGFQEFDAVRAK